MTFHVRLQSGCIPAPYRVHEDHQNNLVSETVDGPEWHIGLPDGGCRFATPVDSVNVANGLSR